MYLIITNAQHYPCAGTRDWVGHYKDDELPQARMHFEALDMALDGSKYLIEITEKGFKTIDESH